MASAKSIQVIADHISVDADITRFRGEVTATSLTVTQPNDNYPEVQDKPSFEFTTLGPLWNKLIMIYGSAG